MHSVVVSFDNEDLTVQFYYGLDPLDVETLPGHLFKEVCRHLEDAAQALESGKMDAFTAVLSLTVALQGVRKTLDLQAAEQN